MTEIHLSRTQAWLESLALKRSPWPLPPLSSGPRLPGGGVISIRWSPGWRCHRRLLQILSNLANDYGDAVKAATSLTVSAAARDAKRGDYQAQMKRALIITVVLICLSGLALVTVASPNAGRFYRLPGAGPTRNYCRHYLYRRTRPYGYIGLGDISVLVFFGWLA
ncbi:hypothetical protein ACNKHO_25165 [Shigella flexneri]